MSFFTGPTLFQDLSDSFRSSLRIACLYLIGMCLGGGSLLAQIYQGAEASKRIPNAELVWLKEGDESLKYVRFTHGRRMPLRAGESWMMEFLAARSEDDYRHLESKWDGLRMEHHRYQQLYRGIPVLHGVFYLHTEDHLLSAANGEHYPNIELNTQPGISQTTALERAKNSLQAQEFGWENGSDHPEGELFITIDATGAYHLAYRFDLKIANPYGRYYVLVDAHTGEVLQSLNRIHTNGVEGIAETKYRGTRTMRTDSIAPGNYRLRDVSRGNGVETYDLQHSIFYNSAIEITDSDNHWDVYANQENAAYDCHWGTQMTYDYFLSEHNLNSYDGNGGVLKSYVRYGNNFLSAFWNGSGMLYGHGDGNGIEAFTSIEVVAHEITHAVTEHSAGLVYAYESGALNESFSDIFGIVIDFYTDSTVANWIVGDEFGYPFRNIADPNQFDHPDTYLGNHWWTDPGDNGGVHTNSGVQNYWFHLLSEGGVGINDNGDIYQATGIGMEKAADIAFRNLTVYLTPNSQLSDARFYAIQSATDLFGACSPERVATTEAWYAVGVGQPYDQTVQAAFDVSQTFGCATPLAVSFVNNSTNAINYTWDFGDGTSSNQPSPSHTYPSPGSYPVSLIASGVALCNNGDTLSVPNLISVTNTGGPILPACMPPSLNGGTSGAGIYQFSLHGINKTSGNGIEGYQDFSCEEQATLLEGLPYDVSIITGPSLTEDVHIWADLNNDGVFNQGEQIFSSEDGLQYHSGTLMIPAGGVLQTPLRMRVGSDDGNLALQACSSPQVGQFEDYSLLIHPNPQPPEAAFSASTQSVFIGQSISFTDQSLNAPTGWEWNFTGGVPSTTTSQHPVVTYQQVGTYPVTLKASNGFGMDSLTQTAFIQVHQDFIMCQDAGSSALTGTLYDSGGPNGHYSNDEFCEFVIQSVCADTITLTFTEFDLEVGFDYMWVYDGMDQFGTSLYFGSGYTFPPTLKATSGAMYLKFVSNETIWNVGWKANWSTSLFASSPPVADFDFPSGPQPANHPISFSDLTQNDPVLWWWDFGDGQISTEQHPVHSYASGGTYMVRLIVDNCISHDTMSQDITIAPLPDLSLSPDSIHVILPQCNGLTSDTLMIINAGAGPLVFDLQIPLVDPAEVLLFEDFEDGDITGWDLYGSATANISSAAPAQGDFELELSGGNSFQGISTTFGPDTISEISFFFRPTVTDKFHGYVVIGDSQVTTNHGIIYLSFTSSGTIRLLALGQQIEVPATPNQDYFVEFRDINFTSKTLDFYLDGTLITNDFPFNASNTTEISAIYLFNFQTPATAFYDQITIGELLDQDWLQIGGASGMVAPGDTAYISVSIDGTGYLNGLYDLNLELHTNDSLRPLVVIPTQMEITATGALTMSDTCLTFDTTAQFIGVSDSVKLENTGCDTLEMEILSTHSAFSPRDSLLSLLPGETYWLLVDFYPDTAGTYQEGLWLNTNAGDSSICLSAVSLDSPSITSSVDSLTATLACGDSAVFQVMLYNIGLADLDIQAIESGQENRGDSSVLLIQNTLYSGMDMDTFLQHQFGITPSVIPSSEIGQTNFDIYDLIITVGHQPPNYYSELSQATSQFEAYASNGGVIQHQNASFTAYTTIAGGVLIKIPDPEYLTDNLLPSHPIMANLPDSLLGGAGLVSSNGWITNLPPTANILTQAHSSQNPTTIIYSFGRGIIIATGMTWEKLYHAQLPAGGILTNAVSFALSSQVFPAPWLNISPETGLLGIGDSLEVSLVLDASSLPSGTHITNVLIYSSDPLIPVFAIPLELTVNGLPEMSVSDTCLHFPPVMQFQSVRDSIWLMNSGCDTLIFTLLTSPNSPFSVDLGNHSLAVGDSIALPVDFLAQTVGTFLDSLQVISTQDTQIICLSATTIGAPLATPIPNSLFITGGSCKDSLVVPLQIGNPGLGDMIFDLEAGFPGYDSLSSRTFSSNGDSTHHQFDGVHPIAYSAQLIITVNGDYDSYPEYANVYLEGVFVGTIATGIQLSNTDIIDTFFLGGPDWIQAISDGEAKISIRNTSQVSPGPSSPNLHQTQLLIEESSWPHTLPMQGWVLAGDTSIVSVVFDLSNLTPGTHYSNIGIFSNDPVHPLVIVPCTLEVTDGPILESSQSDCMEFGTAMVGQQTSKTLTIYNTGCALLAIPTLQTTNPDYTVYPTSLGIVAGDSAAVIVTFAPQQFGPYSEDLIITTTTESRTICLNGLGGGAPFAVPLDTSLLVVLDGCVEEQIEYLSLYNQAGGPLIFSVVPDSLLWTTVPFPSDTILAGDTANIAVAYHYVGLMPDTFQTEMIIQTNDPLLPLIPYQIMILVEPDRSNPEIQYTGLLTAGELITFETPEIPEGGYAIWEFGDTIPIPGSPIEYTFDSAGQYMINLTVFDSVGCAISTQLLLEIGFAVGNQKGIYPQALELYPNPNYGSFWLEYQAQAPEIMVEVSNSLGQLILQKKLKRSSAQKHAIVLPQGTAVGIYSVRILDGEFQYVKQIQIKD